MWKDRGGVWLEASKLMNLVRAESISRALSGDGHIMASRTWLGRRPEGPGAEPLGNDLTPFLIADSGSVMEEGTKLGGRAAGGAWGCLVSISCRTSVEGGANPSDVRA